MTTTRLVALISLSALVVMISACKNDPLVEDGPQAFESDLLPASCNPDTVYFKEQIAPLLTSNCAISGCHGNGSARRGVNLSDYQNIINTGGVNLSNPSSSMLYRVLIASDPNEIMPPPPSDPFTQSQVDEVLRWIEQGALNNSCPL